ncbi:hypothetical protein FOA52_003232 [Chlamydomonas sp. UWO 241]|nr:hypothetical protein FOA52_003232 [Chlamydomonas sp. UWO 241]
MGSAMQKAADAVKEAIIHNEDAPKKASSNVAEEGVIKMGSTIFDKTKEAVARISSGLYVVTAADKDSRSAMVASWVAQASFEPLGLSIAVAKDRAIEYLMQDGDNFVLNCLGEEDSSGTMRHFLKPFAADADRFEGVPTFNEPHCARLPVLSSAIAYMRCKVVSRLETPDHWLLYCEVEDGEVLRPEARTAVQRRKSGTEY